MIAPPRRRPLVRFLRLGFAACCGVVCWLCIALWVRNIWRDDVVTIGAVNGERFATIHSIAGFLVLDRETWHPSLSRLPDLTNVEWQSQAAVKRNGMPSLWRPSVPLAWLGQLWIPLWIPIVGAGALGLLTGTNCWQTRRFSLRAVLIATTLLTLLLSAIVASSRFMTAYAP